MLNLCLPNGAPLSHASRRRYPIHVYIRPNLRSGNSNISISRQLKEESAIRENMHCAVAAVSSSPMFASSPRKLSPIFCKPAAAPSPPVSLSSPSRLSLTRIGNSLNGGGEQEASPSKLKTMMKRKRPAKIDIPIMSLGFDSVKEISDIDRANEVEVEGEGYSVYAKRGKRNGTMEDRYAAVLGSSGDSKQQAFFGVFDGHGGSGAAEFAASNLEKNVKLEVSNRSEEGIEEAVKRGYLATDSEFLKKDIRGGTCCVTAFIKEGDLVVSNAGDCRAVMCRGGVAEALTVDHRPSLDVERERIQSLGGYVDCCRGVWRVHGSLAVSRSIGDAHLKKWVIAEPETKVFKIESGCEFLILASDGLWDKVSNQEAVDQVRSLLNMENLRPLSAACKKLVHLSQSRGSCDDISVMVIHLTHFLV